MNEQSSRLIACIDPGGTTGWARLMARAAFRMNKGKVTGVFPAIELLEHGETPLWKGMSELVELCDHVVIERFALYGTKAGSMVNNEFPPVQVIGVVRYLAEQFDKPVIFQSASVIHRKGQINPLLKPGVDALIPKGGHQRDALAHGIYALHHGKLKGIFNNVPHPKRTNQPH